MIPWNSHLHSPEEHHADQLDAERERHRAGRFAGHCSGAAEERGADGPGPAGQRGVPLLGERFGV
jgi:hypothetical protein